MLPDFLLLALLSTHEHMKQETRVPASAATSARFVRFPPQAPPSLTVNTHDPVFKIRTLGSLLPS